MERDFLGLGTKNVPITVKEETSDSSKDSASSRRMGMNWSFSSNVSSASQFLSFKPSLEDSSRNPVNDTLVLSSSFADAFDSNPTPPSHCSIQAAQSFNGYMVHHGQDFRMLPNSILPSQTVTVSLGVPALQSSLIPGGENFISNNINSQPLGRVPIMAPPISVLPAPTSVVGTTDIRSASKTPGAPAQLTIFYAGSVCVYDDVSPEEAQAIMLLAGSRPCVPQTKAHPTPHVGQLAPCSTANAGYSGSNAHAATASSALSSPVLAFPYIGSEARGSPSYVGEFSAIGGNKAQPSKICASEAAPSVANMIPSVALPQARRASLARFLEKRKERVVSTLPYKLDQKSSECRTPLSECVSSSITSAASGHMQ